MIRWIRRWWFKRKIKFALKLLASLEPMMKRAGISRQERRFLWRSMPDDASRQKAIDALAKNLNINPDVQN